MYKSQVISKLGIGGKKSLIGRARKERTRQGIEDECRGALVEQGCNLVVKAIRFADTQQKSTCGSCKTACGFLFWLNFKRKVNPIASN